MRESAIKVCVLQGIRVYSVPLSSAVNRREAEKRAVEALVAEAFGAGAVYSHAENGAPLVCCGSELYRSVSVSHSRTEAVLAVAPEGQKIGIDVEECRPQLYRVASRVFSKEELEYYGRHIMGLTEAWTLKEAAYKAHRVSGIDFRRDILLPVPGFRECLTVQTVPYSVVRLEHGFNKCLAIVRLSLCEDGRTE